MVVTCTSLPRNKHETELAQQRGYVSLKPYIKGRKEDLKRIPAL
jgi:hypothetical protein